MNRLKRPVLWAALIAVIVLTFASIYGAFIGVDQAQGFFNSVPLALYWFALAALLILGIAIFRRLLRVPSLLLMHLGCILVLAGGMWGSPGGHALQKKLLGRQTIVKGQMPIFERSQERGVRLQDSNDIAELPFAIRLNNFRLEYYAEGTLVLRDKAGHLWRLAAKPGAKLALGAPLGTVTIQRTFTNFRMDLEGDKPVAFDAPGDANPAVEVTIERSGAAPASRYVFEKFPGHAQADEQLSLSYIRAVSDYISELEVVKDGKVVARKNIEVNHPLHYGGYHFYQHQYGQNQFGEYTVLMVVSDSGLNLVYAGYLLLIVGVFWHFMGRRVLSAVAQRQNAAAPAQNS